MTPHGAGRPTAGTLPADRSSDHGHAARVVLGLMVPGVVLLAVGRPELMLYAVFGSFTGMYGRLEAPRSRLRHQFHGAGMLVTGVALGVAFSEARVPAVVLVLGITTFAAVGSLLTDWLRLRPGGPFFGIFAFGATATISPGLVSPWGAVTLCAATAAWSIALGLARLTTGGTGLLQEIPTVQWSRVRKTTLPAGTGVHALRHALATAVAGLSGVMLGVDHANWAMTAAAVPLAVVAIGEVLDLDAVVHRAVQRVTGTLVGLAVTALVLLPEPGPVVLASAVMVLLFPTELFMSRHYGVALGFFTPLIMIMTELAAPSEPATMIVARGVDTVIGVAAGVAAAALIRGNQAVDQQGRSRR
ncbi:FUSC family protein [Nocardioides sp. Root140]|uniref:FUSC family protein n=1 Tax=Nocardioides sp. Root140 TaxID=1736460 RepID=UPI0006F21CA4|nr:FUSC family protein [Nocardioides sp. Root140]KQY61792.1 hypothetical protein ASD30_25420 [Nocardioides sp. Root140]